MLGLPIGVALSYAISSSIAHSYGWRFAFYIAGIPGILCAMAVAFLPEPHRGVSHIHTIGNRHNKQSPYFLVLSIPTMWCLIVSGALHNFNMYAINSFLSPLLMRFHGVSLHHAGYISMALSGLSGIPGLLLGGFLSDEAVKHRANGRLLVGGVSLLASVVLVLLALSRRQGDIIGFAVLMGSGCATMYVYYSVAYATIQDVIEPSFRGTAMGLYFLAMYTLGASFGPLGTGLISDYLAARYARAAGVTDLTQHALEPFRAEGLHLAMYTLPILGSVLTLALFAGSRTVAKDIENLQRRMDFSQ